MRGPQPSCLSIASRAKSWAALNYCFCFASIFASYSTRFVDANSCVYVFYVGAYVC
jgi:hypothetical protein